MASRGASGFGGCYRGARGNRRGNPNRGRGCGRGGQARGEPPVDPLILFEGLKTDPTKIWTLEEMANQFPESEDDPQIEIVTRKAIAAYNWISDENDSQPKIIVPGAPRKFQEWLGGSLHGHLHELRAANEDQAHAKLYVMEAMFTAICICQPKFKLTDYDITADVYAFTILYDFCLETVKAIRRNRELPPLPLPTVEGKKIRINVQVIGSTILMVRCVTKSHFVAEGYGPAFQQACGIEPPDSMVTKKEMLKKSFRQTNEINFDGLKILLLGNIETMKYPDESEFNEAAYVGQPPPNIGLEVIRGGFLGDLSSLTATPVSSHTSNPNRPFKPNLWLNQFIYGDQNYIGLHARGVFDPPTFKTLDEIKEMCQLDDMTTKLWVKILKHVLDRIVEFAREYHSDKSVRNFALICDTELGQLTAHEFVHGAFENGTINAITESMFEYLQSTI